MTSLIRLFYDSRYSHTEMSNPDFGMLAKSMHVHAICVENPTELPQKMKEFLEYDNSKPMLMDCTVKPNEHVFPMVCGFSHPAGRELTVSFILLGSCWKGTLSTDLASESQ